MHTILRSTAIALGTLALAAPASAQQAPAAEEAQNQQAQNQQAQNQEPQNQEPPNRQAPNRQAPAQYVNDKPVLSASLDLGGTGSFTGVLDPQANELCYILNADAVDQPTAAHIHVGGPGEDGAPVVPLATPDDGASGGCVTLEADLAQALVANPGGYYVNIHNAAYPGGAARAQLRGQAATGSG